MARLNRFRRIVFFQSLAQTTTDDNNPPSIEELLKSAPPPQDVRRLQNIKTYLFNGKDWEWINKFVHQLNIGLFVYSQGKTNFQSTVQKTSSITGSQYANALKHLVNLSQQIYQILSTGQDNQPYPKEEVKKIIQQLLATVNSSSFPGDSLNLKQTLFNILTNWVATIII